jgi:hypothetical protein
LGSRSRPIFREKFPGAPTFGRLTVARMRRFLRGRTLRDGRSIYHLVGPGSGATRPFRCGSSIVSCRWRPPLAPSIYRTGSATALAGRASFRWRRPPPASRFHGMSRHDVRSLGFRSERRSVARPKAILRWIRASSPLILRRILRISRPAACAGI